MINKRTVLAGLAVIAASAPAYANVTISTAATQNMNCSGGTCVPTATNAVLNASDLENDLTQFGNVRVMTTGTGVEANNIVVNAAFSSPDSTSLTLDAHKAITVNAAVSIGSGTAELELQSGKGGELGTLAFGPKGHITFASLSDVFGINGGIFTLVGSVQGLASAVAANPNGAFALANSYDAKQDGTYKTVPVATTFTGTVEGLGNTISHLRISDSTDTNIGLFMALGSGGTLRNLNLADANVEGAGTGSVLRGGSLVGDSAGLVFGCHASGTVGPKVGGRNRAAYGGLVGLVETGGTIANSSASVAVSAFNNAGGLVHINNGTIKASYATGNVKLSSTKEGGVGGLVNVNGGIVDGSFATGSVTGQGVDFDGGLVGEGGGQISNSYATGAVSTGSGSHNTHSEAGGLIGNAGGLISSSYSTGAVSAGLNLSYVGGLIGVNTSTTSDAYWDTTTSGTDTGVGFGSDSGVTGLTTEQLRSGLPSGFDPKVWAENPNINNGLPYLIANPPPK